MQLRRRKTFYVIVATFSAALSSAGGQTVQPARNTNAGLTAPEIAGLYQMLDPRGHADPLAAATYLRLLSDGRSRLEGVIVSDVNGSISSRTEISSFHRTPWLVRSAPSGPELCFDVAGKSRCAQMERAPATNDLSLYDPARPRGRADLRLHKVAVASTRPGSQ